MRKKRLIIAINVVLIVFLFCDYAIPQSPGTLKWTYGKSSEILSSPAVGTDGTVYITIGNKLFAINPNGTLKWDFKIDGLDESTSPAIDAYNTVYIGSKNGKFYALNPNGVLKWVFETAGEIMSSPAIGADGTIYIGSGIGYNDDKLQDKKLYAFNRNGTLKWVFIIDSPGNYGGFTSPSIGADGTIYFYCFSRDNLYAVNPNGLLKWKIYILNIVSYSLAIGADDTIYFGSYDDNLYAIKPNGVLKWKFDTNSLVCCGSSPAIGADSTIYLGARNKLYAVKPNGTLRWIFHTKGDLSDTSSTPAIGSDGTIYAVYRQSGSYYHTLYAIQADGKMKWDFGLGSGTISNRSSSPAIGSDGTVYVGSEEDYGKLYAINSESYGLANSPWPMFCHDSRHTGLVRVLITPEIKTLKTLPWLPLLLHED